MEEVGNQIANLFNNGVAAVKNDSLYAPLTQEGNVCGVGANLILVHDPPLHIKSEHYTYINIIDSVEPNTPAARAGMQQGDVIIEVNGTNLEYGRQVYLPDDVADMIRGPAGTEVVIQVWRDGEKLRFVLVREPLDVSTSPEAGVLVGSDESPPSSPSHKSKMRPVVTP